MKSRDDLVYQFKDGRYLLLQVENIVGNTLHCCEINVSERKFKRHEDINYGLVGVFKDHGKRHIYHRVKCDEIQGKLVRSRGLIMTVPNNVLLNF